VWLLMQKLVRLLLSSTGKRPVEAQSRKLELL
jgi:hypothetical protein